LKEIREQAGLTHRDLAAAIGHPVEVSVADSVSMPAVAPLSGTLL